MEAHGARRNPWLASLFSLLLPGLGHVYNGQAKKAVVFYSLFMVLTFGFFVIMAVRFFTPVGVAVALLFPLQSLSMFL